MEVEIRGRNEPLRPHLREEGRLCAFNLSPPTCRWQVNLARRGAVAPETK